MEQEEIPTFELTTSKFLNALIDNFECCKINYFADKLRSNADIKTLVTTDLEKAIWNHFVSDDKFEIPDFNIRSVSDAVFAKHVSFYGTSSTAYGEFMRAFNKLMYRFFNDGDEIFWGPYSAIQIFLHKSVDDRKFYMSEFGMLTIEMYEYYQDQERMDKLCGGLSYLASQIAGICPEMICGRMPSEHVSKADKWCSWFIALVDQIDNQWKGLNTENVTSVDSYYKNVLEYHYPKIYEFFESNYNLFRWSTDDFSSDECHSFYLDDENINLEIDRYDDRRFTVDFHTCMNRNGISAHYSVAVDSLEDANNKLDDAMSFFGKLRDSNKNILDIKFEDFLKYIERPRTDKLIYKCYLTQYDKNTDSFNRTGASFDLNVYDKEELDKIAGKYYVIHSHTEYKDFTKTYDADLMLVNDPEDIKLSFAEAVAKIKSLIMEHKLTYCNYDKSEYKLPTLRIVFDPEASGWKKFQSQYSVEKHDYVEDTTKPINYSLIARTYECSMGSKYWFDECIGKGLFAWSLDKNDLDSNGIKLSDYLSDWVISYCYFV